MNMESPEQIIEWEYKIIASHLGHFKKPEVFQQSLEEEAEAGWRLVEKLSDQRLRLKRPVSARDNDSSLDYDPYRTMTASVTAAQRARAKKTLTGCGWGLLTALIIGVCVAVFAWR